jgi:hypothetical protein
MMAIDAQSSDAAEKLPAQRDAFAFHATRCDRVVAAVFTRLALPRLH